MSAPERHRSELVLVTGGAGFIGSHTVDRLVAEGCSVVVLDDFSTGKRENLSRWEEDPRVEIVEANIADGIFAPLAQLTQRLGPVKRIVHLAAQTSVVSSIENPLQDIRVNYAGTVQIMEYARCCNVNKVVFSSSSAVYSDDVDFPVSESAEQIPLSPYGINKLGSEGFLRYYSSVYGICSTALRFFNVYGPRQDPGSPYSGVISIFADRAIAGETLPIYGDGEQTRDFIFVGDVSRAVVTACLSEGTSGTAINIGTGMETSINELAALVIDLCRSSSDIQHLDPRPGENRRSVAAVERATELLDFRAKVSLRDGLRETLAAIRK